MAFFALMSHDEPTGLVTFGTATIICIALAIRPANIAAGILFCGFTAAASFYGLLLVQDLVILWRGGSPIALLDADDSVVFVVFELVLAALSVLFFRMWRPNRTDRTQSSPNSQFPTPKE